MTTNKSLKLKVIAGILLFFPLVSFASPLKLYVTNATGDFGLNKPEMAFVLRDIRSFLLLKFHLPVRVIKYREAVNTCNMSLSNFPLQLSCTTKWGKRKGKRSINLTITPPLIDKEGLRYIGGAAYTGDIDPGHAWFASQLFNQDGAPRYWQVVNGILHELGHVCGATHQNREPNLMHKYSSQYVENGFLPVTRKTKREVKRICGK